jgi:hypothetical protein
MRKLLLIAAVVCLAAPGVARAASVTEDFETYGSGTFIENQLNGTLGVHFDGLSDGRHPVVRDVAGRAHSGTKVVELGTCDGFLAGCGENYGGYYSVGRLSTSASSVSMVVGYASNVLDPYSGQMTLTAYDDAGAVVGTSGPVTVSAGQPFTQQLAVTSTSQNITRFRIDADTAGSFGFDDLQIGRPDPAPGTPPPPPTFDLNSGDQVVDLLQGESRDVGVDISRANGSNGDVSFAISGLPAGMTAAFDPVTVGGTGTHTTIHFAAAAGAAASTAYSDVTITATPGSPAAGTQTRTIAKLARISENCAKTVRFQFVDLRSPGCMRKVGNVYTTSVNQVVRINGLLLKPLDGQRFLQIDAANQTIKSLGTTSTYEVAVASNIAGVPDIPLYAGPISWDFKKPETNGVSQTPISPNHELIGLDVSGVKALNGLPIVGLKAQFTPAGVTILKPTLRLSFWPFSYLGAITATPTFKSDNDHGADFSGLEIKVDKVSALGIELKDVSVKYAGPGSWGGSAKVVLHFAKTYTVGAGFGIKNGGFDYLNGSVGGINQLIGTGIYLQKLGFSVKQNPLTLQGTIGLSAGPSLAGKKAVTFDGGVTATLGEPFVIQVDGAAKLADQFEIGQAFLRYSSTGLFEFGGHVHLGISSIYLDGGVTGWVAGLHAIDVEGQVSGCVSIDYFPDPCATAKAIVSSVGIAGCVSVFGYGVGAGYMWGGSADAFTGCDLSAYRLPRPTGTRAAGGPRTYELAGGLPIVAWSLAGNGDGPGHAPGVTVTGPHGETVTLTPEQPFVRNEKFYAGITEKGSTFVVVKAPAAGKWTIAPVGDVPITAVRQADGLPKPNVHAAVLRAAHGKRKLRWSMAPLRGQSVQFAEIGKDVRSYITGTSKARGVAVFKPAVGPAGRRRIVALVRQDGAPRTTITVASYVAPAPPRPARVRALKVRRSGTKVTVSFTPRVAGFRHAVRVVLSDHRALVRVLSPKTRFLTITGVAKTVTGTATVTDLTAGNAKGPPAKVVIKKLAARRPTAARAWVRRPA